MRVNREHQNLPSAATSLYLQGQQLSPSAQSSLFFHTNHRLQIWLWRSELPSPASHNMKMAMKIPTVTQPEHLSCHYLRPLGHQIKQSVKMSITIALFEEWKKSNSTAQYLSKQLTSDTSANFQSQQTKTKTSQ